MKKISTKKIGVSNLSTSNEYWKSSLVTFITAFAGAVLLQWGSVEWTQSGIFAVVSVAARAGIKALFEYLALLKV